jgi:hypothetical protein
VTGHVSHQVVEATGEWPSRQALSATTSATTSACTSPSRCGGPPVTAIEHIKGQLALATRRRRGAHGQRSSPLLAESLV